MVWRRRRTSATAFCCMNSPDIALRRANVATQQLVSSEWHFLFLRTAVSLPQSYREQCNTKKSSFRLRRVSDVSTGRHRVGERAVCVFGVLFGIGAPTKS